MITTELYNKVLIDPAFAGADQLFVVSGYATAAMAFHQLNELRSKDKKIAVNLIVGMAVSDGVSKSNHLGFRKLVEEDFPAHFTCSYVMKPPQVHSKVYLWLQRGKPIACFIGSANYTQMAFGRWQREVVSPSDPVAGYAYFNKIAGDAIFCNHIEVESTIPIYRDKDAGWRNTPAMPGVTIETGLPTIKVSLLEKLGDLPQRSGLNWGQRPELHREPNQAYIRLPADVYNTDFFPPVKVHFTVLTDDGKVLLCSRAQQNGKAIHTPHNNSLIGEYFRNRLGVRNGNPVTKEDLLRYGRCDVGFQKLDEETYLMDFSSTGP